MPITSCDNCGNYIDRNAYAINNSEHHFCNQKCKAKWQSRQPKEKHPRWKTIPSTVCDYCGKEIRITSPSKLARNKHHFCSKKCSDSFKRGRELTGNFSYGPHPERRKRLTVVCPQCGKTIEVRPSGLKDRKHKFCSMKCRDNWRSIHESGPNSPSWQGGWERYYGPNWKRQKRAARKRDKYTCQNCGITEKETGKALDVHHIKPFGEFGYVVGSNENYKQANKLSNLISVCNKCHTSIEPQKNPRQLKLIKINYSASYHIQVANRTKKQCQMCKKVKPLSEFHRQNSSVDGRRSYCKECRKYHKF